MRSLLQPIDSNRPVINDSHSHNLSTARSPYFVAQMELAERLLETCWQLYNSTPTGVGAESFSLSTRSSGITSDKEFHVSSDFYLLRPEVTESIMYLYRATGEDKYRKWAWDAFRSWEKHARVASGGCVTCLTL
jgi:hypothetical protein